MQTNWIDGESVASLGPGAITVTDPATEEAIDEIPKGSAKDVDAAVAAAVAAAPAWAAKSPTERLAIISGTLERFAEHREAIAELLTRENGKPLGKARDEVDLTIRVFRAAAEMGVQLRSGKQGAPAGELVFQHRVPRGVAACISPWNYPLLAGFEIVGPNLVAGNTVVWKPTEKTPLACGYLTQHVFADLPPGVLNLIHGDGLSAGEPLVRHPEVDLVCFIGSEPTGRRIGAFCGEALKKCVLELGGNDAMIVDETVSPEKAARLASAAAFENSGQICTSTERIYVHASIFEPFVDELVSQAKALRIDGGFTPDVQLGPVVDHLQLEKIAAQVDDAASRGAEVRCGGARPNRRGYFYPPTVLTNVNHDMPVMIEETFGPVAPVMPFDDFDQAISAANDNRFGLSAIVCTTSAPRAIRAVDEVRAGMVKINTLRGKAPGATSEPFGASGIGHGYGAELLHELTRQKSVHWRSDLA